MTFAKSKKLESVVCFNCGVRRECAFTYVIRRWSDKTKRWTKRKTALCSNCWYIVDICKKRNKERKVI